MKALTCKLLVLSSLALTPVLTSRYSRATEDAILAVQVFDQKKFKKKDQGFLGVINVRIGDVIELADGADGKLSSLPDLTYPLCSHEPKYLRSDAHTGLEKIDG